jgi:hypothetical protein
MTGLTPNDAQTVRIDLDVPYGINARVSACVE